MATRTAKKADAAMCCLTVGFVQILLPADTGLKVASLLRGAVAGHLRYGDDDRIFEIQERTRGRVLRHQGRQGAHA